MNGCKSFGIRRLRHIAVAACFVASPSGARAQVAWNLQETAGPPVYATTVPPATNLNIESVVLAYEHVDDGNILQLQLFPIGGGTSLRVIGPPVCSNGRRPEIRIDERVFPASVLFADDYVVVADQTRGHFSMLSDSLLDAMTTGRTMTLRLPIEGEFISGKRTAFTVKDSSQ